MAQDICHVRDKSVVGLSTGGNGTVTSTWPLGELKGNTPLIYDEANHRIFVAGRKPQVSKSWIRTPAKFIATLPIAEMVDDMAFDVASKRIYIPVMSSPSFSKQKDAITTRARQSSDRLSCEDGHFGSSTQTVLRRCAASREGAAAVKFTRSSKQALENLSVQEVGPFHRSRDRRSRGQSRVI